MEDLVASDGVSPHHAVSLSPQEAKESRSLRWVEAGSKLGRYLPSDHHLMGQSLRSQLGLGS